jgi:hypothetical protein
MVATLSELVEWSRFRSSLASWQKRTGAAGLILLPGRLNLFLPFIFLFTSVAGRG